MNVNVKNVEKLEKHMLKLTIEVSAQDFDEAVEKVYRKNKSQISIPGFRKGKAPRKLVEKMFGEDIFYEEAINDVYPPALDAAIAEKDISLAGYPEMNVESVGKDGLVLVVDVAEKPQIDVENWKGVEAPYEEVEVTQDDVDLAMTPYITRAKTTQEVKRPVQYNDTVNINFTGYKDGEPFDGGTGENYDLVIGSMSFIPGFEEELMGLSAGDEKVFDITFPEDYHQKDLAGQPVQFKVRVNAVKATVEPELDDEFAKDVSEFDTIEELIADLRRQCKEDKEKKADRDFQEAVMDKLIEQTEIDIPDTMIEFERDRLVDNYDNQLRSNGMSIDQYCTMLGTTLEEFKEGMTEEAVKFIKNELILESVARQENVEPEEEDVAMYCERNAQLYGLSASEFRSALPEDSVMSGARLEKTARIICAAAVKVPKAEEEKVEEVQVDLKDETPAAEAEEKSE